MNINDLTGSWYLGQRGHAHQPRKPVVVLEEGGECLLEESGPKLEVGEG